jgi:hypothetical protein
VKIHLENSKKIHIFNKKDMLQKLTFESFQSLSCNAIVYKFSEPIADFNKIPPDSEKKQLFNWLPVDDREKSKETMTLECFQNLYQGNLFFKLGISIA